MTVENSTRFVWAITVLDRAIAETHTESDLADDIGCPARRDKWDHLDQDLQEVRDALVELIEAGLAAHDIFGQCTFGFTAWHRLGVALARVQRVQGS